MGCMLYAIFNMFLPLHVAQDLKQPDQKEALPPQHPTKCSLPNEPPMPCGNTQNPCVVLAPASNLVKFDLPRFSSPFLAKITSFTC
jgi:hypothetical protein